MTDSKKIEEKMVALEERLNFSERITALEKGLAPTHYWLTPKLLAFLGTLAAAAAPMTAAVHAFFQSSRDLELKRVEQDYQMRERYLERALAADNNLAQRQMVLRFLVSVGTDAQLKDWAKLELEHVEMSLDQAHQRIAMLEQANEKLQEEYLTAKKQAETMATKGRFVQGSRRQIEVEQLIKKKTDIERDLGSVNDQLAAWRYRVGSTPSLPDAGNAPKASPPPEPTR